MLLGHMGFYCFMVVEGHVIVFEGVGVGFGDVVK